MLEIEEISCSMIKNIAHLSVVENKILDRKALIISPDKQKNCSKILNMFLSIMQFKHLF